MGIRDMRIKNLSLMNSKLKTKIALGSAFPLILIVVLAMVGISGFESQLSSTEIVEHTHRVIQDAMKIEGAAVDMETGMRGYLLAGKEEFLDPYNQGQTRFFELSKELKNTVSDNPAQVQLLNEIEENIRAWLNDVTEPTIALRTRIGDATTMDDMADLVGEARGKQYFDKFRGQVATFISREESLMAKRQAKADEMTKNNSATMQDMAQATQWVDHTHKVIQEAMKIIAAAVDMETGMRGYLLAGKEEFLDPYKDGIKRFDKLTAELKNTVSDNPAQVKLLGEMQTTIAAWQTNVTEPTIALRRQIGDAETMNDMADLIAEARGKKYFDKFRGQIKTFIGREDELMSQRQTAAATAARTVEYEMAGGAAIAIVIGVLASVILTRTITKPINKMVDRLKDIAQGEGDLTQRVDQDRKDELGELAKWFNTFIEKIHDVIFEVRGTTLEVTSAATQIAASSEQMAQGMDTQKQQVMQISSAIEEMASSVVEVARKSGEAANNATESGQAAQEGGQVVDQTIQGMNAIREAVAAGTTSVTELGNRGQQIGQIIEVINDIADQTNLLALNAAIEAARAGEHGRGFAVVADEVRKLADRTTKATEEIAGSIKAIQTETDQAVSRMNAGTEQVASGVDRATQAGKSLQRIVSSTREVAAMIQSIAAAAEQQSAASDQVSRSVDAVSTVSQQTAEGAKQSASAASQLSAKTEQLQTLVSKFKTRS